ncbi:hypothetical protein Q3G72_017288 [Acer saccharum]|nr:hypothetical protein Q3G72_017288 [Acer saccharum]
MFEEMFGSTNSFGQSSSSPFGSSSVFGQTNNASNNLFAPKPFGTTSFGTTTPFGSTGNSIFGGTSTGLFGAAQSSSPFSSATTFGASSSQPVFGSSNVPAFGSSSSSFGGSSIFGGQKPLGFGSTPTQTSPFGSSAQQSQPAFGNSLFGSSTLFGASSQPAFGASSTPASFGGSSTPAFGATSTPAFGSTGTACGATSTPAFGGSSTPAFGATSTPAFGSTGTACGATSTPAFGGSSTPAFGTTSTPAFGATSTPAFGSTGTAFGASSTPAFGGSSTPAFGATSTSAFGTTSTPAFGATSTPAFGSTGTAFGASSTPAFGGSSTPAFGATSTSAFGTTSTPAFGATSTPAFGSTGTAFGASSTPAFGGSSTPAFGATSTSAFGTTSTPAFGATSTPAFGSTGTAFGTSSAPAFESGGAFGASSAQLFGSSGTPAFGASNTSSFSFQSNSTFGSSSPFGTATSPFGAPQATTTFGSTMGFEPSNFGGQCVGSRVAAYTPTTEADSASGMQPAGKLESISALPVYKGKSHEELRWEDYQSGDKGGPLPTGQSIGAIGFGAFGSSRPFGTATSPFGAPQATTTFGSTTGFGPSNFGGQCVGSRVVAYTPTTEADSASGMQPTGKLESISAMPVYKDKSHEELRWEDYQSGDKGGPLPAGQSTGAIGFGVLAAPSSPFVPSPPLGQSSASPFTSSTSTNLFGPKTSTFNSSGFGTPTTTTPYGSSNFWGTSSANPFGPASSAAPSIFWPVSTSTFVPNSSPSTFGLTPSLFNSSAAQGTISSFGSGMNFGRQSSPLFSSAPGQTGSAFGPSTFGQSNLFSTPLSGFSSGIFLGAPSLAPSSTPLGFVPTPSVSMPFQLPQPAQTSGAFGFSNFGPTQTVNMSNFGGTLGTVAQSNLGQLSATQSSLAVQPIAVTNPFGTLPAIQMSIGRAGTAPSIQYRISSMPLEFELIGCVTAASSPDEQRKIFEALKHRWIEIYREQVVMKIIKSESVPDGGDKAIEERSDNLLLMDPKYRM